MSAHPHPKRRIAPVEMHTVCVWAACCEVVALWQKPGRGGREVESRMRVTRPHKVPLGTKTRWQGAHSPRGSTNTEPPGINARTGASPVHSRATGARRLALQAAGIPSTAHHALRARDRHRHQAVAVGAYAGHLGSPAAHEPRGEYEELRLRADVMSGSSAGDCRGSREKNRHEARFGARRALGQGRPRLR